MNLLGKGKITMAEKSNFKKSSSLSYRAHPWHGVSLGEKWPETVNAYIEIVPSDTVKYELDKETGLLKIDRPQLYSSLYPTLYGMLPQTYCGKRVGQFCSQMSDHTGVKGDDDPLDICVMTEEIVPHGDILLQARPIGGFRLLDSGEADDKILAVLFEDALYGHWENIDDVPEAVLKRLEHFFLTYKQMPGSKNQKCTLEAIYDKQEAHQIIRLAHTDYQELFS